MSLTRFKARNHPQQVAEGGPDDDIDDRATPPEVFAPLNAIHGFTLDAAASAVNAKCPIHFTKEVDGLKQPWGGAIVWCNPPFSNCGGFVQKALYEVLIGGCQKVVMLLPANRCEQEWWQRYIEPFRDYENSIIKTEFLSGRTRFLSLREQEPADNRPPFGCVILTIERPRRQRSLPPDFAENNQGELF